MKIAISAESTIDLTKELLKKYNISTVPFTVLLGEETKLDGEFETNEIINFVTETKKLPKTSAVNEEQYAEHFKNLLKDNDYVIHFSLSSKMSSAYANACRVAEKINNVFVIDSQSLSTGIALLAIYASKLAQQELSPLEMVNKIKQRIPFVQASFVLERLDYLYKGGRCSSLALLGANIFGIKPQIIVTDGHMVSGKKYRGKWGEVVLKYCEDTLQKFNNPDKEEIFITYTTADKDTVEKIKELLANNGFKNIHVTTAGATITSHCGEHCLGILYINDGNKQ